MRGRTVALREMTPGDAATVVEWRNRPDVKQWLIQWEPLTVESHLHFFESAQHRDILLMFVSLTGEPIGTCAFYEFDRNRTCCEWGRLCGNWHPQAMLEGAYLSHRLAFEIFGLQRSYCACSAENTGAQRFDTTLGYVEEGRRRRHMLTPDGYRDVVEFGLLREDFSARQSALEKMLYRDQTSPLFPSEVKTWAERRREEI